jgi:hypothetical protein
MNTSDRALLLRLIEPSQPARVSIGGTFPLTVQVVTSRVVDCELSMKFDATFLQEITESPAHQHLHGEERIAQKLSWRFQAKQATPQTYIMIEGHGEGLFQQIELPLEVTQ